MWPDDFKPKPRGGLGFDDVSPWYDKIEELIGIFGTEEGLENNPGSAFLQPSRAATSVRSSISTRAKILSHSDG